MVSAMFLTAIQRRHGLYLSVIAPTLVEKAAAGEHVTVREYKGDFLANSNKGDRTSKHNGIGGDFATMRDVHYEVKCWNSLIKSTTVGRGPWDNGGNVASVGHLYGFGNTLDKALMGVVGCKERGRQWVKKAITRLVLVETLGGIAPPTEQFLHVFAKEAAGTNTDRTAAVAGDAENINKQARKERTNWINKQKNKQATNGFLPASTSPPFVSASSQQVPRHVPMGSRRQSRASEPRQSAGGSDERRQQSGRLPSGEHHSLASGASV
ncbi:Hypothetical protein EMIHUDRAFT_217040 [Emiliania huxleyi CCMP1516]|uniref:Uncharacterized protein n=2 Tax=Emiliania huxleyi TaxID=2903 RepID=A0A0D3IC02_EMIH1|nr:Hypothetical protein EMIHUDRAFT_217040 [Emiliania huxleyi CCMP1516]EOD08787.1 Hypothetical protein EMIHUDRAFT_217040 [Emiliania huxleyi CCMP1516]|eukprot:XP_005761216.1 Hypothetical protein EMIHUDRAFT_217040 [Emiliania huxleyi CCMP1516]